MHFVNFILLIKSSNNLNLCSSCSFYIGWLLSIFLSESFSVVSDSLGPHVLYSPWNSPGQNTGISNLPFSRGSSQPRDWNQGVLHCRGTLYQLSYQGSPFFLMWIICLLLQTFHCDTCKTVSYLQMIKIRNCGKLLNFCHWCNSKVIHTVL